jgi:hypothetical protein
MISNFQDPSFEDLLHPNSKSSFKISQRVVDDMRQLAQRYEVNAVFPKSARKNFSLWATDPVHPDPQILDFIIHLSIPHSTVQDGSTHFRLMKERQRTSSSGLTLQMSWDAISLEESSQR